MSARFAVQVGDSMGRVGELFPMTNGITSVPKERMAKHGSHGTLAGGGTQFYVPNIKVANVANWTTRDLATE